MMHTTYCSSIISVRAYTTLDDYSWYYSCERCPSTCSCFCSFSIKSCTSFLSGLRQSTLIQCPPSRRFILGSNDRYFSRSSVYDLGPCCDFNSCCAMQERVGRLARKTCENKCCIKERNVDGNKVKGRIVRPRRNMRVYGLNDAEAMLSLLTEECVIFREKKKRFPQVGKVVCKQNAVIDLRDGKEDLDSGHRKSEMNSIHRTNDERENIFKEEDQRLCRRESGSSYFSVSSSGEFGSDIEVEIEQEQFVASHEKDSRKSEGVVISEEAKQDWEKHRNDKDQELQSSRHDHKVGSSIQQNWRKKWEKKLTEESHDSKFRNESVLRQSQLSQAKESSAMIVLSSKMQFNSLEEHSTLDVKSHEQSSAHIQVDNRENVETTSTAWRSSKQREDSEIVHKSVTGCEYCKTCGRSVEESKTHSEFKRQFEQTKMSREAKLTIDAESLSANRVRRREQGSISLQSSVVSESKQHDQMHLVTREASAKEKSPHHLEPISSNDSCAQSTLREHQVKARMHSLVEKSTVSAESQFKSRHRKEEKSTSSLQTKAKEEKRQHDQIYLQTGQVDARKKSQHYSENMDDDGSSLQSNLRLQRQSETRMRHSEEKKTSLNEAEEVKRLHGESSKVSHTEIGNAGVHSLDLEINSQFISDKRVYNEQTYSKAKVPSSEKLVEKRKRIEETIVQSTLQTEVQGPSTRHFSGEVTISQPLAPSISQIGVQQSVGQEAKSEQLLATSPTYQYESQYHEVLGSGVRNDMEGIIEVGSGRTQRHYLVRSPSSYGEVDDGERKSGEESSLEDALGSAARMQESSTLIIGEFIEQMSHEASTSKVSSENKFSKLDLKHQGEKHVVKRSPQLDTDKTGLQKQGSETSSRVSTPNSEKKRSQIQDSKHSSPDSLTKGSTDQMCDLKDHFVQETSEMESLEGATSEISVAVRTGNFLWNIVAGICRIQWGPHSENQKSPVRKQSSPTGSAGGETWFSGDEVDDSNGDGMKTEKIRLLQETTSDQSLLQTTTSQKDNVVMSLDDKLSLFDADALSSSGSLQSSSLSGGVLVSESTELNIPQIMPLPSPSVGLSVPPRQLRKSLTFEEIDEEEKQETPVSSSEEQQSDVSPSEGTDVSSKGGTDPDSKRRLQRSNLVLERFDEWEDAYRREREQRKVDEIFMREALSEAIKAADSWEVPVGAVLVRNGKIIARGYNLVEELRDSTAHAEMICIREASNVLRTWRLSETTLYVTLEPCPMCAGAILQARISTLVWGAPNKLLGADGSWIRLFPEGDERSELVDKPAAPVHPFHPKMNIQRGILQQQCADIMQQFFQLKRKAKPKATASNVEKPGQPTCFPKPQHKSKLLHKMDNVFHPSNPSND